MSRWTATQKGRDGSGYKVLRFGPCSVLAKDGKSPCPWFIDILSAKFGLFVYSFRSRERLGGCFLKIDDYTRLCGS